MANEGLGDRLRDMAEDLVALVTAQLKLTRLELLGDARTLGARLARIAICAPLLLLGFGFIMTALVVALAPRLGWIGSLLLVAALNIGVGAWGCYRAVRAVAGFRVLDRTSDDDQADLHVAPLRL
jgi:hypothetical protein